MRRQRERRSGRRSTAVRALPFALLSLMCAACARGYGGPGLYPSTQLAQANVLSHVAAEQRARCREPIELSYSGHSDLVIETDPPIHEEGWTVLACESSTALVLDCSTYPRAGARCRAHEMTVPTPTPATLEAQLLAVAIESADRIRCAEPPLPLGVGGGQAATAFKIQLNSAPQTSPSEATFSLLKCSQEARIRVRCEGDSGCREISRDVRPIDDAPPPP